MKRTHLAGLALGSLLATLALSAQETTQETMQETAHAFRKGERIKISGRLTTPDERPLVGVAVLLELRRTKTGVFGRKPASEEPVQIPATTGPGGEFSIDWSFDPYYDKVELAVALPVQKEGREDFEIFDRRDLGLALAHGRSPIAVDLVLERPGYLEWLRLFLDGEASAEETKVFREHGRPDRVDREQRRGALETAWWYFEQGKCYRFKEGRLDQIIPFEPVLPP